MVLGDTARAPNQGATIASASIQIHAQPLRLAAAQARAWLRRAGGASASACSLRCWRCATAASMRATTRPAASASASWWRAQRTRAAARRRRARSRTRADYRIVGSSVPRVDIPAKLAGELVFVHDMRVPGMLHGRVVRPPYAGADHGDFIGNTLESVDESSIAHIPGIRAVVVIRDFVGIVAEREEHAEQALRELRVRLEALARPAVARRPRRRAARQPGDAAPAGRRRRRRRRARAAPRSRCRAPTSGPTRCMRRSARRARSPTGSAEGDGGTQLRVWAGTQNPHVLRADLAQADGPGRRRRRRRAHGSRRLLRPQRRRRRRGRCRAARARRRRAGARAAHARAGARVGAQGRGAADAGQRRARCRGRRRRLRLRDLLPVERRADAGAAAHAHHRAGGAGLRDGRPHRAAALRLRQPARQGQRHGADRARLVAARRVGAAELVRARVLRRRAGDRRRRRSGRVPAAPSARSARGRTGARHRAEGRLAHAHRPAGERRRRPGPGRRHAVRPGLCLRALRAQQVARLRRGVVGVGGRCRGQPQDRRGARAPRGGRPRRGPDGQPGRRRAPDPRQRDPDHQPRAEGARAVRAADAPSPAWSRAASGAATRSSISARCR